ncbi:Trm112 family protein [Nocardioides sp. GXZ039]|uniref:Trm112 family protein n=1 Tax=Nocardioides sp. GXZ039 TaxID=3136018 RepID=UPI0030F44DC4
MSIDPALLEIIVCPECHGELVVTPAPGDGSQTELVCQSCGLAYPVRDDIPVLLVDEARRPS